MILNIRNDSSIPFSFVVLFIHFYGFSKQDFSV